MKVALAFLVTLFAVMCICQAYPQPAEEAAASQGEESKVEAKSDDQLMAELKANPDGRSFWRPFISFGTQFVAAVFAYLKRIPK